MTSSGGSGMRDVPQTDKSDQEHDLSTCLRPVEKINQGLLLNLMHFMLNNPSAETQEYTPCILN